jgi:hypothetical protein
MDIPNSLLNSTDAISNEFQKGEGKTAHPHTVTREQIDSPRSS